MNKKGVWHVGFNQSISEGATQKITAAISSRCLYTLIPYLPYLLYYFPAYPSPTALFKKSSMGFMASKALVTSFTRVLLCSSASVKGLLTIKCFILR